jgi:hypothetical protein
MRRAGLRVMRRPPLASAALAGVAIAIAGPAAWPGGSEEGGTRSVFFIAKSENRNEVHYGVALDASCRPAGKAPVFAYWRMRERSPWATEPLLAREQPAYGIASQRVTSREDGSGRVVVTLNAMPNRPIAIDTVDDGHGCSASATAFIAGTPATLTRVFVQLRWPWGVDYLMLSGLASDGRPVKERLAP